MFALEEKRLRYDTNGQTAFLASELRNDGRSARARSTTHTGRDKHHVRALNEFLETLHVFEPRHPLRGRDRALSIDYYLQSAAERITIDVLDGSGTVIRTLKGDAAIPEKKPTAEEELMAMFFGAPPKIGMKAGMNRVAWDLRYEGATVFPGMIMWAAAPARGPLAPPGTYSVRVTANGATKTLPFTIGLDPRLEGVTPAHLQEQFALASKIRDAVSTANAAVIQVRAIRQQVQERLDKVPPKRRAEIQKLVDGLMGPLTAVEEDVYQVKNHSFEDPLNFPIKLNNKIASLAGIVESADHRPTDQSYAVFTQLTGQLDAHMAKLNKALDTELPRVNAALKHEKIAEVKR